jgi:hypothetical protein
MVISFALTDWAIWGVKSAIGEINWVSNGNSSGSPTIKQVSSNRGPALRKNCKFCCSEANGFDDNKG